MKNKCALITGSARRVGKALALALHSQGYDIALHHLSSVTEAESLCQQLNSIRSDSAKTFCADLCKAQDLNTLSLQLKSWRDTLSVLINNASLFFDDQIANQHWQKLFDCNVKAPYLLSQYCYPMLKQHNGIIINLTDIHANQPLANYHIYGMTKAALRSQTFSLAKAFSPEVRVNAIAPGAILWPEHENALDSQAKVKIINQTPLKKAGGTEPIVKAALHYIENDFITGTELKVDGGRSI